jgi:hypothetical protein
VVLLATFGSAPFCGSAVDVAVEAAVELGASLLVVDVVEVQVGLRAGVWTDVAGPAAAVNLRRPVTLARERGAAAKGVRVCAVRPRAALLDVVRRRRPAIVVFGPDPAALSWPAPWSRVRYRHVIRGLDASTECLLWHSTAVPEGAPVARR